MSTDSSRAAVWGARDPPAIIGKDGATHAGVPRQGVFGIGGIAEFAHALNYFLLVRHRAGVHGGDARPCNRPERDQVAHCTATRWNAMDGPASTTSAVFGATESPHSRIRRPDAKAYHGGYDARSAAEDALNQQIGSTDRARSAALFRTFNVTRSSAAASINGGASTAASDGRSATYNAAEAMKPTNQA